MKNFTLVATGSDCHVVVIIQCDECKAALGSWTGVVGIVHVPLDDVNGDTQGHVCEA